MLPAVPAVLDTLVRARLALAARRGDGLPDDAAPPTRWLVVVPARAEGRAVESTLRSLLEAATGHTVRVVVLVDGADPDTESCAHSLGIGTVLKEPAGPSKGAALAWLVREQPALLAGVDAVLLIDVGSHAPADLFARLRWPGGAEGVQTRLAGVGRGAGEAVAHSERAAQEWEDRGRQALGWGVRLRGTGTALTPRALGWVAPRLRTRIEDLEASLLLASAGFPLVLSEAEVRDEKPARVADAARQRARWLVGRVHLAFRHAGSLLRLVGRRPGEGMAFALELASRPLSLTALVRAGVAAVLVVGLVRGDTGVVAGTAAAAVLVASILGDLALLRLAGRIGWRSAAQLMWAWLGAVALAPRALLRWTRVKR
ncbi:MAG: glycosyltransferase [Thermoanaerobaculaceae bacterium]|nr:glycosyltransferase [Thermoanaerobaculaceae bacterium]